MNLTEQKRRFRDPNKFPTTQLFFLALVRLAEPIALTSIFPYAWKLVRYYDVTSEDNAAFYAGILISSFSLAEACSGMYWGSLSDRIGRKPVLLLGCAGTLLSLLMMGFATNFWVALLGRALGGVLNGNIGVIQTMVGELVHKPEHEPRAFAVMPFAWAVASIIGPSIGGYFAEPADNFPIFSRNGLFGRLPYLLPNLICAFLLFLSIVAGYFFLEETHPDLQPWCEPMTSNQLSAETPLMPTAGATAHAAANLTTQSYGTFDNVKMQQQENWLVKSDGRPLTSSHGPDTKIITKPVIMLVVALGIFTYHTMTYDHLLPIFLQDSRTPHLDSNFNSMLVLLSGGLGLSIQDVGLIMSANGIIALFIQAIAFPVMAECMGIWNLFALVTTLHPLAYFIVPYLVLLPSSWLYPGIYACLAIRNFLSILAYPLLLILIKEAVPSASHLGKVNGLAASTGAASRTIASPVAGFLYGTGSRYHCNALPWWASSAVAVIGAIQLPFIMRRNTSIATRVHTAAPCCLMPEEDSKHHVVVHITVEEINQTEV